MADAFTATLEPEIRRAKWTSLDLLFTDGLRRTNEDNDAQFYASARKRPFFNESTDRAMTRHHERIIPSEARRILDLMSGEQSHLPRISECEVIGLGLNREEMQRNKALHHIIVCDLNRDPHLPFEDESFDAVVCSGSIDLLTQPLEVMREVARVLRKGGVFIVNFTDRTIMPKSIEAWRDEGNEGRLVLATAFFTFSGSFLQPLVEVDELVTAQQNEAGSAHKHGDEILSVVWSYKPPAKEIVKPTEHKLERLDVPSTRHCPYCGKLMLMWQPPQTPWEIDYNATLMYVCFNDDCNYFTRGRRWCRRNGMRCATYRHSRNPETGVEGPLPVPTMQALRAGIVEET